MSASLLNGILNTVNADIQSNYSNGDPNIWSMFRGDLGHTGYSNSSGPMTNQTLWKYATGSRIFSSPSVVNGVVFVGSDNGYVNAFNSSSGDNLWSYQTGSQVESSPAIADGVVYVGSDNGNVYALNGSTGVKLWSYATNGLVISSPAFASGRIFVGSYDSSVYALNASTGEKLWSCKIGSSVFCSPTVANDVVYVGDWFGTLYALNAATGAKLWTYLTDNSINSSPAIDRGMVYIACGSVYALDAFTGSLLWRYSPHGGSIVSSPAFSNGIFYVIGSSDGTIGTVYALNESTGNLLWNCSAGGAGGFSSPAIATGVVYIGSRDTYPLQTGSVYALNASSGAKLWSYSTGAWVDSSPAIAAGIMYVGSNDGTFYVFGSVSNLAITDAMLEQSSVQTGFVLPVNVTIQNDIDSNEIARVELFANLISVFNATISLGSLSSVVLNCAVDTTGLAVSHYTITASVTPIDDAPAIPSVLVAGTIEVTYLGDLNGDFRIDVNDVTMLILDFNNYWNTGHINPMADYNHDGKLDANDVTLFVLGYNTYLSAISVAQNVFMSSSSIISSSTQNILQYPTVYDGYLWIVQSHSLGGAPTLEKCSLTTNSVIASTQLNSSIFEAFSAFVINGLVIIPSIPASAGGYSGLTILNESTLSYITLINPVNAGYINVVYDSIHHKLLFGQDNNYDSNFSISAVQLSQVLNASAYQVIDISPNPDGNANGAETMPVIFNNTIYVSTTSPCNAITSQIRTRLYSTLDLSTWTQVWEKKGQNVTPQCYFADISATSNYLAIGVESGTSGSTTFKIEYMGTAGTWHEFDSGVSKGAGEDHPDVNGLNNDIFLFETSSRQGGDGFTPHSVYAFNCTSGALTLLINVVDGANIGYNDRWVGIDATNNYIYMADCINSRSPYGSSIIKIGWNLQLSMPGYLNYPT